ncbi:MAG TPA: hypothetical protein VKE96_11080 [Vicinamibacterales bacterium]|nr:hypothetical protein [Vicinamibacterales bacterium]
MGAHRAAARGQWPATEKLDLDAIYRLKDEGLQRSKVMEIAEHQGSREMVED